MSMVSDPVDKHALVIVQNFTDLDYGPSMIVCQAFSKQGYRTAGPAKGDEKAYIITATRPLTIASYTMCAEAFLLFAPVALSRS